jgi:hypothetical protein
MTRLLALLLVISMLACGCADVNDEFIQGSWYYRNPHLINLSGESHLEITWTFAGGTFEYYSCCFNGEFYQTGRYEIAKSEGDSIVLELFNQRGSDLGSGRQEIGIKIDRDQDTLTIQAAGPYSRTLPVIR